MTVLNLTLAADADDGYWAPGFPFFSATNHLYFGNNSSFSGPMNVFAKYAGAGDILGTTINEAVLTMRSNSGQSGTCAARLYMNDIDTAVAPTSVATAEALALTTAYTDWSVPSFTNGGVYESPDFSNAVQEIADRGGFGGTLMALIKDNGSASDGYRRCDDYDQTADMLFDITYTAGGAAASSSMLLLGM